MATRDELYKEAKEKGLDVNSKTTKADLEKALSDNSGETSGGTQGVQEVEVNPNDNGEATNGTEKEGQDSPVENTESVPQNGVDSVETFQTTDNEVATRADESRTEEEVQFADESNPNQKARNAATDGAEVDQDGRPRTGGKSYGVAADDPSAGDAPEANQAGEAKEEEWTVAASEPARPGEFLNPASADESVNNNEWTVEDQQALEEKLSRPDENIKARVITSAGTYVKVKYYRNNLAFGSYTSRNFDEAKANEHLDKLLERR